MKSVITSGLICVKDKLNVEYFLAKIEYQVNEDETFEYRFSPYYNVIELLDSSIFQGIPGLDLDLKKEVYIRKNKTPVFISERAPSENRENLIEMLESVDMDYLNQLEWLIRTNLKYSGDNMYVKRYEDNENVEIPKQIEYIDVSALQDSFNPSGENNTLTFENGSRLKRIETNGIWRNYLKGDLVLPSTVEYIGDDALSENNLTSVSFPTSAQYFEDYYEPCPDNPSETCGPLNSFDPTTVLIKY